MAKNDEAAKQAPESLSERRRREIVERLEEKGVRGACPLCGQRSWIITDGYFNEPIQGDLTPGLVLGGPSIPSIGLVCSNCGFISRHALGVLELLDSGAEDE